MPPPRTARGIRVLTTYNIFFKGLFKLQCGASRIKPAFTLAEILITLGIIGVVAAMTMPSLIANHKELETVVKVKKFYSLLEQAVIMSRIENEEEFNTESVRKEFKTTKTCVLPDYSCALKKYKYLSGSNQTNWGKLDIWTGTFYAQIADGTIIRYAGNNNCEMVKGSTKALMNVCGEFSIDINGDKLPNQMGKDVFFFYISKYGVVPFGTEDEYIYSFTKDCKNSASARGLGCSAWLLQNENMDYLHCNDLDWKTKTKCK